MTKAQVIALIEAQLQPLVHITDHVLTDEFILDYIDQAVSAQTQNVISTVTGWTADNYYDKTEVTNILTQLKLGGGEIVFDGLGGQVQVGSQTILEVPYDCTISSFGVFSDSGTTGNLVLDILTAPYPGNPLSSICGGNFPTITSDYAMLDSTLTGWSTALTRGTLITIRVQSCTLYQFTCSLQVIRS